MKLYKYKDALIEIKKPGVTYLEFTTSWCGDCKVMVPFIEKVEEHFKGQNIKFIKVDAEEADLFRDSDSKFQVLKVPTHIILKDGEQMHRGYEFIPSEKLIEWIEDAK